MRPARISFKGDIAFSESYADIYFNVDGPQKESEHVFASAIDEIWHKQDSFIVAELGFGAGLNFFTLAKRFIKSGKILHFISIEARPITKDDLTEIYEKLGIFKRFLKKLVKFYPPMISGIHRIKFADNITLDLCFGEAKEILAELEFEADIWFLDGFAPSKNQQMWSDEIFMQVARLTKLGGIARTYSCAKIVRENFARAGFLLELKRGYGKKRQMSHALLRHKNLEQTNPWFALNFEQNLPANPKILIIGAGISGLATAHELAQNGFSVTIAEKASEVASNGSGNICGALMPLITKPSVALGRMHLNAFLQASRFYKENLSENEVKFNGCIEYAYDELILRRFQSWENEGAEEIFKFDITAKPYPAMAIKNAAYLRPKLACQKLAKAHKILFSHTYVGRKRLKNGQISVKFKTPNGAKSIKTDILVFAAGSQSVEIFKNIPIIISSVRGQVTHIERILDNERPLSALGYICPAINGVQVVGATYGRNEICDNLREKDDKENLEKIAPFVDKKTKFRILGGKVGYRNYSSDRFPIIGAMPEWSFYEQAYKDLFWSKRKGGNPPAKYEPNVYLNIAHGSRGLCTAILGARTIADLILKRPLCIEKSLLNELHPARFMIRRLKRG